MERTTIVIVAKAVYPSTFPRATRATELAIELARQGNIVTLYAELGEFDYTQFEQEHRVRVKNIGRLIFSTSNSDGRPKRKLITSILQKFFKRILEFPDIELMFRMPAIIKAEKNADLLISIAVPYPIHWGCALAKSISSKIFPKVWIADCGDPYMGNRVTDKPPYFYFEFLEKWFCRRADILAVPVKGAVDAYYPEFRDKIVVIPQGVRFPDWDVPEEPSKNDVPTFAYAGTFYKGFRDPSVFLEYLTTLKTNFKCIFFVASDDFLAPYAEKLGPKMEIRGFVPRVQLLTEFRRLDFLLNFENNTSIQSPSKLIDYAIVNKPVLAIPQGALPIGTIQEFINGDYRNKYVIENPNQFRIENVARQFLSLYSRCRG